MKVTENIRTVLLAVGITCLATNVIAQEKPTMENRTAKKEKVEELKIAFITKELDLNSEEAEKFWPVYNEMSKKMKEEKKAQRTLEKDMRDNYETLSDADLKKKVTAVLDSEIKQIQIKKEYTEKIAGIVGQKKAVKLLSVEQRFKRELLKRLNDSQNHPQGKRPDSQKLAK